jgi:hypothetical protein
MSAAVDLGEGIALAGEMALLGAASMAATPANLVLAGNEGWPWKQQEWAALGARLRAHEAAETPARMALIEGLRLGREDYWLLCLLIACEYRADAAAALSIIAEDERVYLPTPLGFARLMQAGFGSGFAPALQAALEGGRLAALGLVEAMEGVPGRPLSQRALRLAPGHAAAVIEGRFLGAEAPALAIEIEAAGSAPIYPAAIARGAAALLCDAGLLVLRARSARTGRQFALDIAGVLGERALVIAPHQAIPAPAALARLSGGIAVLDLFSLADAHAAQLGALTASVGRLLVIAPAAFESGPLATVTVPTYGAREGQRAWREAPFEEDLRTRLATRFRLTLPELRAALREAAVMKQLGEGRNGSGGDPGGLDEMLAERAVRAAGARRMGRLVTLIDAAATLDHLVAPPAARVQIKDIIGWHRVADRVQRDMGLADSGRMGHGLTCLFSGPPGTGKTFAARCVAAALRLNLYRIDLSQVVSKYIGETEKALAQVFDEAEAGHGVLFFDEADALFGKRSEVKDAHDRYANIEVGYLLQRIETFDGILILATNLRNNIDPAFLRRIQFLVDFPMPDATARRRLWEQALPAPAHRAADLDPGGFAARFRLAGGNIDNIARAAAHLAAAEDGPIGPGHLARATYRELEKIGQARAKSDFGTLARHLPEDTWAAASR